MKPVDQDSFSDESAGTHGNCYAACIASILERPQRARLAPSGRASRDPLPMIDVDAVSEFLEGQVGCPFHRSTAGVMTGVVLRPENPHFGRLQIGEWVLESLETATLKLGLEDQEIAEKLRNGRSYLVRYDDEGEPSFLPIPPS